MYRFIKDTDVSFTESPNFLVAGSGVWKMSPLDENKGEFFVINNDDGVQREYMDERLDERYSSFTTIFVLDIIDKTSGEIIYLQNPIRNLKYSKNGEYLIGLYESSSTLFVINLETGDFYTYEHNGQIYDYQMLEDTIYILSNNEIIQYNINKSTGNGVLYRDSRVSGMNRFFDIYGETTFVDGTDITILDKDMSTIEKLASNTDVIYKSYLNYDRTLLVIPGKNDIRIYGIQDNNLYYYFQSDSYIENVRVHPTKNLILFTQSYRYIGVLDLDDKDFINTGIQCNSFELNMSGQYLLTYKDGSLLLYEDNLENDVPIDWDEEESEED